MKKLNITFCSFPDFAGNAKALYEYMEKTYKDKMNYTWIVYNKESVERLKRLGMNAILIGTNEFKNYIPKTNVFFTTHANLTGDKWKCKNALYIELWHGISPKKLGYMMNNISIKDRKWYRKLSHLLDYVIVPSELWQTIYASRFYLNINQILPIAYPKLDLIKNKNAKDNLSKILKTNIERYNKIILYAPTFRSGCGRKSDSSLGDNIIDLKKYDENVFINYLKNNNYLLCVKEHPSEELNFTKNIKESFNIRILHNSEIKNNFMDIYDVLDAADLLITDFSSLGVEFIYLDKPVVYLNTKEKEYLKNRGIVFSDFNFWTSNTAVNNIDSLIQLVDSYFKNNNYIYDNLDKKKLFFSTLADGGCGNICDYFFTSDGQLKKVNKVENDSYNYYKTGEKLLDTTEKYKYYKDLSEKQQDTINIIVNSRGWKLLEKLRRLFRR